MVTQSDQSVDFGVMLSTFGPEASPEAFERVTRTAERAGFDAVWAADHVAFPERIPNEYPFSPDGEHRFEVTDDVFDIFQVLASLATITDDIAIGSNIVVAPYRHPVILSKNVLSLDAFSGGRFEFGVGAGWLRTEFDVLDVPYDERGSRLDEFLDLWDDVRRRDTVAFDGPHHSFQRTGFHPRPVDPGGPPIWIGGSSSAAFRRLGEYGDGWTVFSQSPAEISAARERIVDAWDAHDREEDFQIGLCQSAKVDPAADESMSVPMTGSPEAIVDDVEQYVAAGVTRVMVGFYSMNLDDQLRQLQLFGDHVLPAFD